MKYTGSDKHKLPWQRGRCGSLCPKAIDQRTADGILATSRTWPEDAVEARRRYGIWEGRAFCAVEHVAGEWHGWPVGWKEVPEPLRRAWRGERLLSRRQLNKYWLTSGDEA